MTRKGLGLIISGAEMRSRCLAGKKKKTTKIGREIERKENCPTNLTEFLRKTINFVGTSPFSLVSTENSCRKAGGEFSLNKSRDFAMISIAENCRIHVLWIFIEVCYVEDIFKKIISKKIIFRKKK